MLLFFFLFSQCFVGVNGDECVDGDGVLCYPINIIYQLTQLSDFGETACNSMFDENHIRLHFDLKDAKNHVYKYLVEVVSKLIQKHKISTEIIAATVPNQGFFLWKLLFEHLKDHYNRDNPLVPVYLLEKMKQYKGKNNKNC